MPRKEKAGPPPATPTSTASPPGDAPSTFKADGEKSQTTELSSPVLPPMLSLSPAAAEPEPPQPQEQPAAVSEDELDELAAKVLETRAEHTKLKQAHLSELSLGALKSKLRILRVPREKIEKIDYTADPRDTATRLFVRADKPPPESWRVQAALSKEHQLAHRLVCAKQERLKAAGAFQLARAHELQELEEKLVVQVERAKVVRLQTVLADERQLLKGEKLSAELKVFSQTKIELTAREQYAEALAVENQIEEATLQLQAISHSLRAEHRDHQAAASPLGRKWHESASRRSSGTHKTRTTEPFGAMTHVSAQGWHARTWHMADGKQPSPDSGQRRHVACQAERVATYSEKELINSRVLIKEMKHHGNVAWGGAAGIGAKYGEAGSPATWETTARTHFSPVGSA